jgi:hypothetical protein
LLLALVVVVGAARGTTGSWGGVMVSVGGPPLPPPPHCLPLLTIPHAGLLAEASSAMASGPAGAGGPTNVSCSPSWHFVVVVVVVVMAGLR